MATDLARFATLDFDGFRALARDASLSRHEKIGFPDAYRDGKEAAIFRDVLAKLGRLQQRGGRVLEIGPGCSHLPLMLAEHCARHDSELIFVDSAEMLALLPDAPDAPGVRKVAGAFPQALAHEHEALAGRIDAILVYSVVQYVHAAGELAGFVDACLALLAPGGELLLGDLPNATMRERFFASPAGQASHRAYIGHAGDGAAPAAPTAAAAGHLDDGVVLALLAQARARGFHAWVMPQASELPMANRREDVLIRRP